MTFKFKIDLVMPKGTIAAQKTFISLFPVSAFEAETCPIITVTPTFLKKKLQNHRTVFFCWPKKIKTTYRQKNSIIVRDTPFHTEKYFELGERPAPTLSFFCLSSRVTAVRKLLISQKHFLNRAFQTNAGSFDKLNIKFFSLRKPTLKKCFRFLI